MNHGTKQDKRCPCCGGDESTVFYAAHSVPVNSVLLLEDIAEAKNFTTGEIVLGICRQCGFITNLAFQPELLEYSDRYESTQSHSPTFNAFAHALAANLIARHDLRGKRIIEIGCGQGEFLTSLCELGGNSGVGFDPAYLAKPDSQTASAGQVKFVADYYSETYAHYHADFIACKMTLEHVHDVSRFVRSVRNAIGERMHTVVFFQVPNMRSILEQTAFWDVYYEHCSYFSPDGLADLFRRSGFEILDVSTAYDDQYIFLEASAGPWLPGGIDAPSHAPGQELPRLLEATSHFRSSAETQVADWNGKLDRWGDAGQQGVIWGAGSKAVSFLSALGRTDPIVSAVDINPKKHGTYLPVTGLEVVSPESLSANRPDFIIVMNPVYMDEIRTSVEQMGLSARLLPLASLESKMTPELAAGAA